MLPCIINMLMHYLFCILFFVIFLKVNMAEWVEMPQFSNENKIYRVSSMQHEQFFKLRQSYVNNVHFPDDQRNDSQIYQRIATVYAGNEKKKEIKKINFTSVSTTPSNLFRDQIAEIVIDIDKNRTATNTEITIENKPNDGLSIKNTINNILTTQSPLTTMQQETLHDYYNHTLKQDNTMFQYLPMDIFKSVHRTLQSQPVSFEGKLHFLQTFEKTLMTEIESRLTKAMAPRRKKRGADYSGHDHDDHDDHSIGFPSIEGALMAISFLTFAVYLVRLVMLLFRNTNNQMPTTTAATVFFGKRKRSADFNDNAARILNNINNFNSDL